MLLHRQPQQRNKILEVFPNLIQKLQESFRKEQKSLIQDISKNLVFYEAQLDSSQKKKQKRTMISKNGQNLSPKRDFSNHRNYYQPAKKVSLYPRRHISNFEVCDKGTLLANSFFEVAIHFRNLMPILEKSFSPEKYTAMYSVDEKFDGLRLDQFIKEYLPSFSREVIKKKIKSLDVCIMGRQSPHRPSSKVYYQEKVEVQIRKNKP